MDDSPMQGHDRPKERMPPFEPIDRGTLIDEILALLELTRLVRLACRGENVTKPRVRAVFDKQFDHVMRGKSSRTAEWSTILIPGGTTIDVGAVRNEPVDHFEVVVVYCSTPFELAAYFEQKRVSIDNNVLLYAELVPNFPPSSIYVPAVA